MKKSLTTVAFKGTKEQEDQLRALIAQYKGVEGSMMPVLQGAQEIYGYLPVEVQKMIADGMDILTLLTTIKVVPSRSEGRRAVQQGGVKLAEKPVTDVDFKVTADLFTDGKLLVQKGKKTFHNVILK